MQTRTATVYRDTAGTLSLVLFLTRKSTGEIPVGIARSLFSLLATWRSSSRGRTMNWSTSRLNTVRLSEESL